MPGRRDEAGYPCILEAGDLVTLARAGTDDDLERVFRPAVLSSETLQSGDQWRHGLGAVEESEPAIAVARRPAQGRLGLAAHVDRRMWPLHGLGLEHDRGKAEELALVRYELVIP